MQTNHCNSTKTTANSLKNSKGTRLPKSRSFCSRLKKSPSTGQRGQGHAGAPCLERAGQASERPLFRHVLYNARLDPDGWPPSSSGSAWKKPGYEGVKGAGLRVSSGVRGAGRSAGPSGIPGPRSGSTGHSSGVGVPGEGSTGLRVSSGVQGAGGSAGP